MNWQKGFRNKKFWALLAALALVAAAGLSTAWFTSRGQSEESTEAQIQTASAQLGELKVTASGAGELISATEIGVAFDESGTLTELLVSTGDTVEADQVLARLSTDQTGEEVALALAEADLSVINAQQALDELYDSWQMDAAEALKSVEDAGQSLGDLQNSTLTLAEAEQAVAEAQEAVRTAQSSYNGTRSTADENTIDYYRAQVVLTEAELRNQQSKFNEYANKPDDDLEKAARQLKLSAAQDAYDEAVRYYNAATGTGSTVDLDSSAADLAVAQAQLADAERELERVQDGPTAGELALAEAELAAAQKTYATLKDGPDPAEIALAEATLANAKAELAVAQEDQAVIELRAPLAGTILSIDATVGETIGTDEIITLADLNRPILEIYLDETDMDFVAVGNAAEVVFDSLPDETFTGQIIEVDPSLQTVSNVDALLARVQLDADANPNLQTLPVGSNATIDVIGGWVENAVLVPVEALHEIDAGEYTVFVMENGEPTLRVVTVGLMDYTYAEITSGLEAGETVTTGTIETQQASSTQSDSAAGSAAGEMPPVGEMMPPQ
jgi:HlyD family secretion protein